MSKSIVLASGNAGKLAELAAMLAPLDWQISLQSDYQVIEAEETGTTFIENAIIKARNACQQTGLPAIADDSGLEVDALDGRPGVYSARYAGVDASNEQRIAKLLQEMQSVPEQHRTARFHSMLVYMRHTDDPTPLVCHGVWEGRILAAPTGSQGFGYDPVFYVPSHNCSAAELDKDEKNRISHRGQALRHLLDAMGRC